MSGLKGEYPSSWTKAAVHFWSGSPRSRGSRDPPDPRRGSSQAAGENKGRPAALPQRQGLGTARRQARRRLPCHRRRHPLRGRRVHRHHRRTARKPRWTTCKSGCRPRSPAPRSNSAKPAPTPCSGPPASSPAPTTNSPNGPRSPTRKPPNRPARPTRSRSGSDRAQAHSESPRPQQNVTGPSQGVVVSRTRGRARPPVNRNLQRSPQMDGTG